MVSVALKVSLFIINLIKFAQRQVTKGKKKCQTARCDNFEINYTKNHQLCGS